MQLFFSEKLISLSHVSIGNVFKVKMQVTVTCDNHYCTFFGHLGHHNTDRIISIGQGLLCVAAANVFACKLCKFTKLDILNKFVLIAICKSLSCLILVSFVPQAMLLSFY